MNVSTVTAKQLICRSTKAIIETLHYFPDITSQKLKKVKKGRYHRMIATHESGRRGQQGTVLVITINVLCQK